MYTCITSRASKVSYIDVGEGGVAVNCETKKHFFPEHPVPPVLTLQETMVGKMSHIGLLISSISSSPLQLNNRLINRLKKELGDRYIYY